MYNGKLLNLSIEELEVEIEDIDIMISNLKEEIEEYDRQIEDLNAKRWETFAKVEKLRDLIGNIDNLMQVKKELEGAH